ncbi:MAG: hypothetical protein A2Z24_02795 [Candidatus Woykebacteria bacterium RBG_16_44_10]|uniref:Antitoxin n=1 Tax=Candidatus Woykebacteria bacterium RBG_16_44_10 TaxID=1802597 RepID=A0A1G1WFK6_9BACT|nr:MAG: hypothetical protein A2Z24_02795 [Candidatus Woykebacteria bacterium RBG_16_44_10]
MIKTIGMLELRKRPGEFLDETFYRKSRFLIKRNRKAMAVLVPIEDFARYFEDEDIEIYTKERLKEFQKSDKTSPKASVKAKKLLYLQ